jgi:signal transduction histidine kinase
MELNETLQAHTKDLIVVNRELEQFSYIVSHNLRAPVANIIGLAEELSDESYDPETKLLFTDSLKISASMLNEVITDLNSVVQIKNEVTHRKEIVNLDQLTQTILATINHIVVKDDVQVICDFAKYKELLAAKSYLHSIIYNLISNAIKYKRHSVPPVIHIESIPFPDGVEIKITDNGMGIDLEKKSDEIFKMYKRFHSHVEGKGIGLFMVKTQVEILGGTISVESEVGKGSVFRVFVPQ